jgi:hypothetical protein
VIDACQADLRTVCGEEPFEAGRLSQCIERNKDKVSPACQAVWPSAAEPQAPRIQNRVVPMGERRLIGFFSSLYPDCSSQGPTVIRTTEQPRHGSVTFSNESSFPSYASSHHLSTCNLKKVEGIKIFYEPSDPDYSGLDEFSLLIIGPIGFAFDEKYRVSIR